MEILVSNIGLYEWQLIRNDNDNSKDHIMDGTSKDDLIDSLPKDDFMTIIGQDMTHFQIMYTFESHALRKIIKS